MFAILAVNIVGDKLGYCKGFPEDDSYYGVNEATVFYLLIFKN